MRRALYILGLLTDEDIEWIVGNGQRESLTPGTKIITEGQPLDSIFIVVKGKLMAHLENGNRKLSELEPGELLGEISLLDSRPPTVSVSALEESLVVRLLRTRLFAKLEADSEFAARFYKALGVFLAQRLRQTTASMGTVKEGDLDDEIGDEIDPDVIERLALAGKRYHWIIEKLKESAP